MNEFAYVFYECSSAISFLFGNPSFMTSSIERVLIKKKSEDAAVFRLCCSSITQCQATIVFCHADIV
jgi:hypothetical protein